MTTYALTGDDIVIINDIPVTTTELREANVEEEK